MNLKEGQGSGGRGFMREAAPWAMYLCCLRLQEGPNKTNVPKLRKGARRGKGGGGGLGVRTF